MSTTEDPTPESPPPPVVLSAADAPYALPQGYRLQEYAIEGVLGSGGFGITYLATDHNLACKVAIKEYLPADQVVRAQAQSLQPRCAEVEESFRWGLARFIEEARALAAFRHAHIVRVLRFFEANATAYMVMELVTGEALGPWIRRNRPIDEASLLGIVRPILDGLGVVHEAGFVHRDVKPGNIHMRADTDPVLLDFGSARRASTSDGRELTAIVTPGYAALEQYHTQGNQGPWTDLYSVAALMYGIISGKRPIEAPARVRNDPLPKAIEIGDRTLYSEALLSAVDWALNPEEERRPQSVQAFLMALPEPSAALRLSEHARAEQITLRRNEPEPAPWADRSVITQFEAALAGHLGPMAPVLVRRVARNAASIEDLRAALSLEIDSERSRRSFLERTEGLLRSAHRTSPSQSVPPPQSRSGSAPPSANAGMPSAFDPAFLSDVESELARHLGPLARVLVKKAANRARDRAELFLLLSDNIADAEQRRAFIRKSVAAFKHHP